MRKWAWLDPVCLSVSLPGSWLCQQPPQLELLAPPPQGEISHLTLMPYPNASDTGYFKRNLPKSKSSFLFQSNPCQHPIVILRDVREDDLRSLLNFMYNGEVEIDQDRLKGFLRTAETLQVKGLTDNPLKEQCQKTSSVSITLLFKTVHARCQNS